MKPKISTGYLTPQAKKAKKPPKRLSESDENAKNPSTNFDESLFETLMKCPAKKKMILELLASNKDAIEKYKNNEVKQNKARVGSPVAKVKKTAACESPTALLRRRALERMNGSPNASNRSHSRQSELSPRPTSGQSDISSSTSASPVPFNKILDGVVVYVEIRSKDQDRSAGAKAVLKLMGAKVRDEFTNDVTHVVFKDGSFTTYQKARLMKIHLVSILWVEFSRKTNSRQREKYYPAMKSSFCDDETSMVCSQMHREYEDIIREEYRCSIIHGTPLPSMRDVIDRRRTLMTPSTSSFRTAAGSISSQELSDEEVATINGFPNEVGETLIMNDPDGFSQVKVKGKGDSNAVLRSVENIDSSDMDLTLDRSRKIGSSDSDMEITPKNFKTPQISAQKVPSNLFNRRKTICNSLLSSDASSRTSLISSDMSTSGSNASSDKSTNISRNASFAIPNGSAMKTKKSTSLSDSNESFIFSRNVATSRKSKPSCANLEKNIFAMSLLNLSSDKKPSKNGKSDINASSQKNDKSSMSDLHLSSEKNNNTKQKSSRSSLELSSDKQHKNIEISSMSGLHLSSNAKKSSEKSSTMSSLKLSSDKNSAKPFAEKSSMSDLHLSSEKIKIIQEQTSISSLKLSSEYLNGNTEKSSIVALRLSSDGKKSAKTSSVMSSLNLSSDKNSAKPYAKNHKSLMSDRHLSPETNKVTKKKSSISFLKETAEKSLMSTLHLSSEGKNLADKLSVMSSLQVSIERLAENVTNSKRRNSSESKKSSDASFASSKTNSCHIEEFVGEVIEKLTTPECNITQRKKSCTLSASKSITSDDSEIISPRKSFRRSVVRKRIIVEDDMTGEKLTKSRKKKDIESRKNKKMETLSESDKAKSSESDSAKSTNKKKRKLYNPDDPIEVVVDDDLERAQKRIETRKRKSDEGIYINPVQLLGTSEKPVDKNVEETPPRKETKEVEKRRVILNSSADEQKELLDEVISKKLEARAPKKSPESKIKTPKASSTPPARRKSTRLTQPPKKYRDLDDQPRTLSQKASTPKTPANRRSTLDFQPASQRSVRRKAPQAKKSKASTIVCTKLHNAEVQVFTQIVKKLGRFVVEDEVNGRTTHLVAGEPKRTINMLRALARGCWVLRYEWILKSLEAGKWLPEEDFEVTDFSPAVQKSRVERQAFGPGHTLDVFRDCGGIYVAPGSIPRCSDLRELAALCKGTVVTCPRMAQVVVGEFLDRADVTCVSETWLLDCITFDRRMPFKKKYLLQSKRQSLAV